MRNRISIINVAALKYRAGVSVLTRFASGLPWPPAHVVCSVHQSAGALDSRADHELTLLLTGLAVRTRELRSCSNDRPCSFRMPTSSLALGRFAGLWSKQASINCASAVRIRPYVSLIYMGSTTSTPQASSTCAMEAGHSSGTLRTTCSVSCQVHQFDGGRWIGRAIVYIHQVPPYRAQATSSWALPSHQLPHYCAKPIDVDLLSTSGA